MASHQTRVRGSMGNSWSSPFGVITWRLVGNSGFSPVYGTAATSVQSTVGLCLVTVGLSAGFLPAIAMMSPFRIG